MFQNLIGAFVHDEKSFQNNNNNNNVGSSSSSVPQSAPPAGSSQHPIPVSSSSSSVGRTNVSSTAPPTAESKRQEEKDEVDEDALAGTLLVQFPTYGTRSQASSTSLQWQEKTADWLLGGHNVPTSQQLLKQQQIEQQQRLLAEEAADRNKQSALNAQKVLFKDWAEDEQTLWKTKRFHHEERDKEKSETPYQLKEYDVTYVKPVLEDPTRDLLAAYYYHTGVFPKPEPPRRPFQRAGEEQQQQRTRPSPFLKTQKGESSISLEDTLIPKIAVEDNDDIIDSGSTQNYVASPTSYSDREIFSSPAERKGRRNSHTKSLSSPAVIEDVAWMPDQLCKTCYSCDAPFSFLRRRHHCRICGQVFCNSCSGYFVPATPFQQNNKILPAGTITGVQSPHQPSTPLAGLHTRKAMVVPSGMQPGNNNTILRTCKMCFEQVMAQQKKKELDAEEAAAADAAKKRKQEDAPLLPKLDQSIGTPQVKTPSTRNDGSSPSLREQLKSDKEGGNSSILQNLSSKRLVHETPFAQKRLRSKEQALEEEEKEETTKILQRMGDSSSRMSAEDLSTMSPTRAKNQSSNSLASEEERTMAVKEGNRELGKAAADHLEQMAASLMETDAPLLWKELLEQEGSTSDDTGVWNKMQSKWVDKLMSLATRCCATVDPNVKRGDLLDIRPYVKIKGRVVASALNDPIYCSAN
jgi:FYVE zinc finger